MNEETKKKIRELQIIEQHLQNVLAQKQNLQIEFNEAETAINELEGKCEEVYKIISGVMIKSEKKKILEELNEKKRISEMRINSVEKQQEMLEKKSEELKKEIEKKINK